MAQYDVELLVRVKVEIDSNHPSVDRTGAMSLAVQRVNYLLNTCGSDVLESHDIVNGKSRQINKEL